MLNILSAAPVKRSRFFLDAVSTKSIIFAQEFSTLTLKGTAEQ